MVGENFHVRIELLEEVRKILRRRLNRVHGAKIYPRGLLVVVFPQHGVIVHFRQEENFFLANHVEKIQSDCEPRERHPLIDENSPLELFAVEKLIRFADGRRHDKNILLRHEEGVGHVYAARCANGCLADKRLDEHFFRRDVFAGGEQVHENRHIRFGDVGDLSADFDAATGIE